MLQMSNSEFRNFLQPKRHCDTRHHQQTTASTMLNAYLDDDGTHLKMMLLHGNPRRSMSNVAFMQPHKMPDAEVSPSSANFDSQFSKSSSKAGSTGKTSTSSSPFDTSQECVICGAPASGVHYMVWSCNGCKTFFRRAIMENRNYSCSRDGNCVIDLKSRCCCRHCRFKKCIKVGMTFTELNVERKRRLHMDNSFDVETVGDGLADPVVRELLAKEKCFRILLSSLLAPVYATISETLRDGTSIFNGPMELFENVQIESGKQNPQFDFYDWRARILSISIEWIKSFPEFMELPPTDQQALAVHSAFALLVFSECFHTPERFSDRLVYPDGLQVTRNFSKGICIPQNGLIRGIVAVINYIMAPIRRIQLTEVEYVFLQTLLLFDPDCLSLSEPALEIVNKKREQLLDSLNRHLKAKLNGNPVESANRMAQLMLRIPNIHKVASFKHQFFRESAQLISGLNCAKSSLTIELANLYPVMSFF